MNSSVDWHSIVEQVVAERDSLRQQNVELWKVIAALKESKAEAVSTVDAEIQTDDIVENLRTVPIVNDKSVNFVDSRESSAMNSLVRPVKAKGVPELRMSILTVSSVDHDEVNVHLSQELYKILSASPSKEMITETDGKELAVNNQDAPISEGDVNENGQDSVAVVKSVAEPPNPINNLNSEPDRKSYSFLTPPPPLSNNKHNNVFQTSPLRRGSDFMSSSRRSSNVMQVSEEFPAEESSIMKVNMPPRKSSIKEDIPVNEEMVTPRRPSTTKESSPVNLNAVVTRRPSYPQETSVVKDVLAYNANQEGSNSNLLTPRRASSKTNSPVIQAQRLEVAAFSPKAAGVYLENHQNQHLPMSMENRIDFLSSCHNINVEVISSGVRLNEQQKEYLVYILSIKNGSTELWRVQKKYSDFLTLHEGLKKTCSNAVLAKVGKAPSKNLFQQSAMAPSKSDKRRISLELFLNNVLKECLNSPANISILQFLSLDVLNLMDKENKSIFVHALKEGYLTKKGKRIGGWKNRYFVLKPDKLEYYESQEHAATVMKAEADSSGGILNSSSGPLGVLLLKGARLAKQKHNAGSDYRHAFLITEGSMAIQNTASGQNRKHILCADSDVDRDEWAWAIANCIARLENPSLSRSSMQRGLGMSPRLTLPPPPTYDPPAGSPNRNTIAVTDEANNFASEHAPIRARASTLPTVQEEKEEKSGMGKLRDWLSSGHGENESPFTRQSPPPSHVGNENVFGVPLIQSIQYSKAKEGYELPSVVFRCIEYLDHHRAHLEEGIYRLSGRSQLIQSLKSQFNKDGDVNMMKNPRKYDVHSIAGLLKLFLRELPDSLLTNEMHNDFLHITDLNDRSDKIIELARLVSMLPLAHYTLLRTLVSHLITVVQHSDVNKMTARNVGIVFSPTLNIPAGIFTLMMAEFEFVFWVNGGNEEEGRAKSFSNVTEQADRSSKRLSWRPNQVEVQNRSNRNSKIYEENAPDAIKFYEELMIKQRDSGMNFLAEKQLNEFDEQDEIDFYDQNEGESEGKQSSVVESAMETEEDSSSEGGVEEANNNHNNRHTMIIVSSDSEEDPVVHPRVANISHDDRMSRTFSFIEMYDGKENRKSSANLNDVQQVESHDEVSQFDNRPVSSVEVIKPNDENISSEDDDSDSEVYTESE